jgi:hypothetical protein
MKPRSQEPRLLLIGRREYVDFPDWGVRRIRAKIDTGAWSSALDVSGYELGEDERGRPVAHFRLERARQGARRVKVTAPVVGMVSVTSSTGTREQRPLLEVPIRVGPVTRSIRLTLANRLGRRTPMLLGRQALAGVFLVDVRSKYLLTGQDPAPGVAT